MSKEFWMNQNNEPLYFRFLLGNNRAIKVRTPKKLELLRL